MSDAVTITLVICATLLLLNIIGKIPTKKSATYIFDEQGHCKEAKDEYK